MNEPITDKQKELADFLMSNPNASEWQTGDEIHIRTRPFSLSWIVAPADDVIHLAKIGATTLAQEAGQGDAAELARWREIGRRLWTSHRSEAVESGGGSALLWTFHCANDADEVKALVTNAVQSAKSNLAARAASAPESAPGKVEVSAEYLAKLERPWATLGPVTMWETRAENNGSFKITLDDAACTPSEGGFALREARDAYRKAHPPAPPKSPGDRALDLLETSYRLGREGSEDAAVILRDAGRLTHPS